MLFIGYGLEELEVLQYVVLKARAVEAVGDAIQQAPRHFMVQRYFSHQEELVRSLESTTATAGSSLFPFGSMSRTGES